MVWTAKASAPAYFSLADAFVALITGDATWGWLVDWATLVPSLGQSTAAFCADGPISVPDLSAVFGPQTPNRNPIAIAAQGATLAASIALIARNRVFGAYCENVSNVGAGNWGAATRWTAPKSPANGTQVHLVPASSAGHDAATSVRVRMVGPPIPATSAQDYRVYQMPAGASFATWSGNESLPTGYSSHAWASGYSLDSISFTIAGGADYEVQWNDGLGRAFNTPTPQLQPAGYLSPLNVTPASLAGIAAELDRQEFKLDFLVSAIQAISGATIDLAGDVLTPVTNDPDVPVSLADAAGVVITATGTLDPLSLGFGTPQEYARLGRINFGTADAWFPSVPLAHTPMVLKPLPTGATRVVVTGVPPGVTVSIALIARNK